MAVPGSYNDQDDVADLRAHYGWVVYQRTVTLPERLGRGQRVVLRFDAATHRAEVFLNGERLGGHVGGFLPFEFDVTGRLREGANLLTVAVDNRVNQSTLPVGNEGGVAFFGSDNAGIPSVEAAKRHARPQNLPNFDFFNYAGLNRHVELALMPAAAYIEDVTVVTTSIGDDGDDATGAGDGAAAGPRRVAARADLRVDVAAAGPQAEGAAVRIGIVDEDGREVAAVHATVRNGHAAGTVAVERARLWNPGAAYLYTARITLTPAGGDADAADEYLQTFGIRTVAVEGTRFLINGRPFYFKGAAKHEDPFFHGRGTDPVLNVKDLSLFRWLGAVPQSRGPGASPRRGPRHDRPRQEPSVRGHVVAGQRAEARRRPRRHGAVAAGARLLPAAARPGA